MANADRPNGFTPVKHLTGAPYNGQFNKYFSPNDNLFLGDIVEADATGDASGYATVGRAEAADAVQGVVVGWEFNPTALENLYHAASTVYAVHVADSPDLVLEVQVNDAGIATGDIGLNVNFIVAAGNTTTGVSNMEIDGGTEATTATLPFRLIGFSQKEDNDFTLTNAKLLVMINNHKFKGGTGTVGL